MKHSCMDKCHVTHPHTQTDRHVTFHHLPAEFTRVEGQPLRFKGVLQKHKNSRNPCNKLLKTVWSLRTEPTDLPKVNTLKNQLKATYYLPRHKDNRSF